MSESNGKKILVVDDEFDLAEALCNLLEDEGHQTEYAGSGNKAFEYLQSNSVDVVISDVKMADGTGVDLLMNLQAIPNNEKPQFILVSGFSEISNEEAAELGADLLLNKPVDFEFLLKYLGN